MKANVQIAQLSAQINEFEGVKLNREQRRVMLKVISSKRKPPLARKNLVDPCKHAIDGARITDEKLLSELEMRDLSSLDALMRGAGGMQEWWDMDAAVSLCLAAAKSGVGPEAIECCTIAKQALEEAKYRHIKTGVMGLSGVGIQALRDVNEYAYVQRRSMSRSEFEAVMRRAINDLSKVPAQYMRTPEPTPPKAAPDKAAIKAALQKGEFVDGCELGANKKLVIL